MDNTTLPTLIPDSVGNAEGENNNNSNNNHEVTASNSNDSMANVNTDDIKPKIDYEANNPLDNTINNVPNEGETKAFNDISNNVLPNTENDAQNVANDATPNAHDVIQNVANDVIQNVANDVIRNVANDVIQNVANDEIRAIANEESIYMSEAQAIAPTIHNAPNAMNTTTNNILDSNNLTHRDDLVNGDKKVETANSAQVPGYGPNRGTAQTTSDARFDPLRADPAAMTSLTALQSAATKQALANAKQQALLAQKLKQMNPYTWPGSVTTDQSPYGLMYPMWPLDSAEYAAYSQAFANPQQAAMAMNPGLMGLNPLVNPLVTPLMNPFNTLQNAFTAGIPDGKQHALFVFHLPEDIDDHGLLQLFGPYGAIRANVMRQEDGRTKGFGFVHFNNRHDASIAIEMMNGHQIGRKRLMVSFKKNKEDSHANNIQTQQKPHIPQ